MLKAGQIRNDFIEFFKSKGHQFVPSSPIVPIADKTLLFANAGMNQFKDIFTGLAQPKWPRAVNSQKCLRVSGKHNDLEEVGKDTYHHTFFEMLGNWSFGDYFKAEAIEWAWELLTGVWGIDKDKLWATVFAGDQVDGTVMDSEAKDLWTKVTPIAPDRVLAFGRKDNFWEMGASGPCGPCSEIHIDLGPDRCDKKHEPGHKCGVNVGCSRFMELWNLVFIQYNRDEQGKLTTLKSKHIDTGAGLERVVSVLQNKTSNYDTDLFMPIIEAVSDMSGHKYTSKLNNKIDNSFRVIADHSRALSMAIADGAIPSNDGRGYVIRRILRRAARFGRELGMHEPFIYKLVPVIKGFMAGAFPEIGERADHVASVIEAEEASFGRTLDRGIEIFNSAAEKASKLNSVINGDEAFALYDTYGFPFDLTRLMADERGLKVDTEKFDELMEAQRQRARAAQKTVSLLAVVGDAKMPVTADMHKYHADSCQAKIVGFVRADGYSDSGDISADQEAGIVLDKTVFYAESGGQVGDCGLIEADGCQFIVEDTMRAGDTIIHQGKVAKGKFRIGQSVTAKVSKDRESIKKNHTATHLLQWALQTVVGKSVAQQGSLVSPDYLRFDFTCPKALTAEQTKEVEALVRGKIEENQPVTCVVMDKDQAQELGAMALFGEKYGSEVRVVAVGIEDPQQITDAFSKEFCGGTHVSKLGDIGGFKIIKEESISTGVRRITALTGTGLSKYLLQRSDVVDELCQLLRSSPDGLAGRTEQLISENKKLSKELKSAAKQGGGDVMAEAKKLLDDCQKIGDASIIVGRLSTNDIEQARVAVDMLKKKAASAAIVFGMAEADKVTLLAAVSDDLVKKGVKAGDIVKEIAPIVGGGGGGRPQMAQAGGKDAAKLDEALAKAKKMITDKLA